MVTSVNRRAFLKVAGAAGLALATGCQVSSPPSATGGVSPTPGPRPTSAAGRPPQEILVTPTGDLYIQSYDRTPQVDTEAWRLHVHGLVDHEATLSLDDIRAFPKVDSLRTLECIGNPVGGPLIGNVVWSGMEAAALWQQVGIHPEAVRARFEAEDDYSTSVELKWITQPGVPARL